MDKKVTREDLEIKEGKFDVKFIEVDGKKLSLTPLNSTTIENHITHEDCSVCGAEFKKQFTYEKVYPSCQAKKLEEDFFKMQEVEWDYDTPLYLYDSTDQYFFDFDDLHDYAEDAEVSVGDLKLILCRQSNFSEINIYDHIQEDVHEDWEPSQEFETKVKEFNKWLTSQSTNTWLPTNKRVRL